ncbi:MAG TPA: hypothetical protein VGM80_00095 [Gaiellaceae bacterium]
MLQRLRSGGSWPVLLGYCVAAFLLFGLRLVVHSGNWYEGSGDGDPQIPIWSFAWWPHALAHGQNPFVTHVVWAPHGVDLTWVNTLPIVSVLFAPLTWLAGPVASYNVAAILLPAVSAWTAFLLCRYVTRRSGSPRLWPSVVGGYLFGFSSYMLAHLDGQPQLTAMFLLPVVALLVLRFVDGEIGHRRFALELGLVLAAQLYLALEIAFTLTLALAAALLLGYGLVAERRERIRASLRPLAAAYGLGGLLGLPVVYYALTDLRRAGFTPPDAYVADLANVVIPTHVEAVGAGWTTGISTHFAGNVTEQGVFIGPPLLVVLIWFAWAQRRSPAARFLVAFLALAAYASLGPHLTVYGHRLFPLPTLLGHDRISIPGHGQKTVPIFNNTLPVRLTVYTSLAASVAIALWAAGRRAGDRLGVVLVGIGVLLLIPNPALWATRYTIPAFFTDARYRTCLRPNANVLPQPIGAGGDAMLWQVADDFRFRMAGGRLQTSPPSAFLHPDSVAQISVGYAPVPNQAKLLSQYIARFGVTDAIVDLRDTAVWAPALDRIARRHELGGVLLYPLAGPLPRSCPAR